MGRNLLLHIFSRVVAGSFIAIAPIVMAFAALVMTVPAFAQASPDSAPPVTDYALPPPDGGSLVEPSMPGDATPDGATPDDASAEDGSPADTTPAIPADGAKAAAAGIGSAGSAKPSDWSRDGDVDGDSESEDPASKVLEVPQVIQSDNSQPAGDNSQASDDDADQTAQGGESPPPEQVGNVDQYQNEDDSAVMGVYAVPVPFGPVGMSPYAANTFRSIQAPVNQGFLPGFAPGMPFGTVNVRRFGRGMNSTVLSTSPMFPRTSMRFSGGRMFGRSR